MGAFRFREGVESSPCNVHALTRQLFVWSVIEECRKSGHDGVRTGYVIYGAQILTKAGALDGGSQPSLAVCSTHIEP